MAKRGRPLKYHDKWERIEARREYMRVYMQGYRHRRRWGNDN